MSTPWLYRISRQFVRLGLRGYFDRIEIVGRENVLDEGPVIYAANHPHSITDALVLGRGAGRMLHFIAHSGLFRPAWKAWFLRSSGVIPVYRAQDVQGAAEANAAMFSACFDVLANGEAIGIFPEGTSAEERRVGKLKTGTARIALGAEQRAGWDLDVKIVPVGLNFESIRRFRSRVLIRFGKPVPAADYRQRHETDPVAAAVALTERLQDAVRREVVNIDRTEFEQFVRDVENIYKSEILGREGVAVPGGSAFERDQNLTREFARAFDFFFEHFPETIWSLSHEVKRYNTVRHALRLKDEMLRAEEGPGMRREVGRFAIMGLSGLPWAVIGIVGNYLPYKLTGWLAAGLSPDRTKIHAYQFTLGMVFFLPWYGFLIYEAAERFGLWGAVATGLALPPAGLFARVFTRYLRRRRAMIRFAWLELVQGYRIRELRLRRRNLIRAFDEALDQYLTADGPKETP